MYTWNIDPVHSEIGFKIKHMMVSTVKGSFSNFSGTVTAPEDKYENTTIKFEADATSVNTNNAQRDNHLRSADFFEVEKFPKITFESTKIVHKEGDEYAITGNFTLHGVTKEITFNATFNGINKASDGTRLSGFDIKGTIKRSDFGLMYNAALEAGGVLLSDDVILDIVIELKEAK